MSSNEESGEKTEEPTDKKIRDLKKKGFIPKSTDVVTSFSLIGVFLIIIVFWQTHAGNVSDIFNIAFNSFHMPFEEVAIRSMAAVLNKMMYIVAPVLIMAVILAIVAHIIQFGGVFSFEQVTPKMEKLNPAQGIKRIFSLDNLFETIKALIKTIFLGSLIYGVIRSEIPSMVQLPAWGLDGVLRMVATITIKLIIIAIIAFILMGILDFFLQKRLFQRRNKMTKHEVKREWKEMEGDPQIKGQRKNLHYEFAFQEVEREVEGSTVVVTNPTHFAVALRYKVGEDGVPKVVAKGTNLIARRIIEIAQTAKVPVIQDPPLARGLYFQIEVKGFITEEFIKPVAQLVKWAWAAKAKETENLTEMVNNQ